MDEGKMVGLVFIDLSKAFDTIGHSNLLSKLRCYGVTGGEIQWFQDYSFNGFISVSWENELSNKEILLCGVPQGSILGPLLFLVYYNDFPDCIHYSNVIMFADDTALWYSGNSCEEIEEKLNYDLKNIAKYFTENVLIINLKVGKTESILFGTAKSLAQNKKELNLI